jgi:Fe-S-cluster-containing dehydrogenase component
MGDCHLMSMSAEALRTLADRNPGLLPRLRRIAVDRRAVQKHVVGGAATHTTQHVFKDLYRMQMARSLLVIDQDTCVRCGHCAWTCAEVHDGVSRLVRRGDKVVTRLAQHGEGPRSLLLPNSCQHCKNPACMIDCPTGAIGRDLGGEVFIRPELCTGCGNCAKACPWENIQMAPRPRTVAASAGTVAVPTSKMSEDLAVKCDLCRAWDGPACVQACPTASIFRLDPTRDVAEVAALLAEPAAGGPRAKPSRGSHVTVCVGIVALGLGVLAWRMQAAGLWRPGAGVGLAAGWSAAVVMLLLVAHALPKRWPRLWLRERVRASAVRRAVEAETPPVSPRSKMRPLVVVHVGLGLGAMVAVVAHAGSRVSLSVGGLLHLSFWTVAGLGLLGTCVYRYGPRALGRLEREGMLPEDFAGHREALTDRLYRDLSGRSELCKTIAARVAVPYSRSVLGPLRLLLSRRSLAAEERRLRASIETMLQGRGHDKLEGLGELVRTVVELRALPVRAALTGMLRGWLPLHMLLTGVLGVLLLAHVVTMGGRP